MFELKLIIYPYGSKGEYVATAEGVDICEMKEEIPSMILEALTDAVSGEYYVEMLITRKEQYYDCDDAWVEVDLENKTVKIGGM